MSYSTTILSDSPTVYARLGEVSGTVAADSSGHGFNGTYTGGFTLAQTGLLSSDSDKAVALDGSGYIDFGDVAQFDGVNSMECLVKVNSFPAVGTYSVLIAKGYDGTQEGYQLSLYNDNGIVRLNAISFDGVTVYTAFWNISGWTTGTTHHVVGEWDGVQWRLYFDGAEVGAPDENTGVGALATMANLYAGAESIDTGDGPLPDRFLNGTIDEVAVYDHALSAARVLAHYNASRAAAAAPPNNRLSIGISAGL